MESKITILLKFAYFAIIRRLSLVNPKADKFETKSVVCVDYK